MKKRFLIPGAAIGGIAVYLASQFLSLNLGDISVPSGTEMNSVEDRSSASEASQNREAEADAVIQKVVDVPGEKIPEKLLLVDIVIDGEHFTVNRVTNAVDTMATNARQPATIEEIIAMIEKTEGDKSGTRVRVSRTSEAVASAETRLMEAIQTAGVSSDEVDRRSRLVE